MSNNVLLINWAGADWHLMQPLMDTGQMPHVTALVERGVMGKLSSGSPLFPTTTATTVATGVGADQHGIVAAYTLDAGQPRGLDGRDLETAPLWERVAWHGVGAAVVNWPLSHPATDSAAMVVSDAYCYASAPTFDTWALPPHCLSSSLAHTSDVMSDLRLHPNEVTAEQLLPFIPRAAEIDQETDPRLAQLAIEVARTASVHGAGTWLADNEDWSLLMVNLDFIQRLSNLFLEYAPPKLPQVSAADFERFQIVVDGAYRFCDMLLGRYLELVEEDTHVLLVSDHGYRYEHQRQPLLASRPGQAHAAHRPIGILAAAGERFKRDELVFGARSQDIAPTVLHLLGLPVDGDLHGEVLQRAFETPADVKRGAPFAASVAAPVTEDEAAFRAKMLGQWRSLGYVEPLSDDPQLNEELFGVHRHLVLARLARSNNQVDTAVQHYEAALAIMPDNPTALLGAAACHFFRRDADAALAVYEEARTSGMAGPPMAFIKAQLAILKGDLDGAREALKSGEADGAPTQDVLEHSGQLYLAAQQWPEAADAYQRALELDPDSAIAHAGVGRALLQLEERERASEHFMMSLGLLFYQPSVHYLLGICLAGLGRLEQAEQALKNALSIQPDFEAAESALSKVTTAKVRTLMEEFQGSA